MPWWNPFKKKAAEPKREPLPTPNELLTGLPKNEKGVALYNLILQAEKDYDDMYESRNPNGAYSNMKDSMTDALILARELGLDEKVRQLDRLLDHRKAVFRSQMS
jgi:hypothetical protein